LRRSYDILEKDSNGNDYILSGYHAPQFGEIKLPATQYRLYAETVY